MLLMGHDKFRAYGNYAFLNVVGTKANDATRQHDWLVVTA